MIARSHLLNENNFNQYEKNKINLIENGKMEARKIFKNGNNNYNNNILSKDEHNKFSNKIFKNN